MHVIHAAEHETHTALPSDTQELTTLEQDKTYYVNDIIVAGNKQVPTQAILDRIPCTKGEIFEAQKTRTLINNLYYELKHFRTITVKGSLVNNDRINLYIIVEEKKMLKDTIIEGNTQVTRKEINAKINFSDLPAIDEQELKRYSLIIKKIYLDKGYHLTEIDTQLRHEDDGTVTAIFKIKEHQKSLIKRIFFKGNHHFNRKQLSAVIFTREDWLLGFLDKSGTYQADRLAGDKHMLEQFYQNNGYMNAKVVDIDVQMNPATQNLSVTYEIKEGDLYTIGDVHVSGNDLLSEEYLKAIVPLRTGDVYSRENLVNTMKTLEFVWGDLGYIYAHIEPTIQPNEETKTVNLSFDAELGSKVFLNKINVRGNYKTRDKIIRRKIALEEGGIITNSLMEHGKNNVASLGYFDQRDGVNWKTTRLSEDLADLDLIVKERKTGDAHLKLGFGGSAVSISDPTSSLSVEGNISDINFGGSGVSVNLSGKLAADEKTFLLNITQPWMFDRPIYGSLDLYHKRFSYDWFTLTQPVTERFTGGALTTGFVTSPRHRIFNDMFVRFSLGGDHVNYGSAATPDGTMIPTSPKASIPVIAYDPNGVIRGQATHAYNKILAQEFEPGTFLTYIMQIGRDRKNHPQHPSNGSAWIARSVTAFPALNSTISYQKFDLDFNWYTPLIGDYNLIFRFHSYLGFIIPFKNRVIPYRELFHIGGPASVRGFLYGQIGPQFTVNTNQANVLQDSIGGDKTFFMNVELIFPIMSDFSMKGVVFYDGGAGWHNPFIDDVPSRFIRNNGFNFRQSVGAGIRIYNPIPLRIDWGFKLDPRKGETASEVHFGMSYDW